MAVVCLHSAPRPMSFMRLSRLRKTEVIEMERKGRGRRPVEEITDTQINALKEIRRFTNHRGFPPTIKELADILGISHASAHGQVNQLVRKGYLKREARKARSLAIVREPEDTLSVMTAIPIVGRVAAGRPILAVENIVGEIMVEGRIARSGRCFALEVAGDSMVNAGIRERDLVVVREQPVAENGDIVVALLEDEATVKRLFIRDEKIELRPENPKHRPIPVGPDDGLRILGKVIAVRHRQGR
ncbi:MAG TPA: transcriptional repressor LexA [Nitrospira sp.]|nr:transcriptional repressor LexA [Nitrospira sp.]